MPEDVLRVAGNCRGAPDIGCRCHGQKIRNRFDPHASRRRKYEGNHHQADDVVDEKRGEQPAEEDHSRQQMMRFQPGHDQLCDPIE